MVQTSDGPRLTSFGEVEDACKRYSFRCLVHFRFGEDDTEKTHRVNRDSDLDDIAEMCDNNSYISRKIFFLVRPQQEA